LNALSEKLLAHIAGLRPELIATAQELVRLPSINHPPSGDEYQCQMAVARRFREMGLEPEVYRIDTVLGFAEHPSFWPGRDYSNRPNVVARRKGLGGGRSLVLSGHIDTVPLGLAPWRHDPFGAVIEDGRMYGLGAFDMKGGVACILGVLRAFQGLDIPLKGDLVCETVVDEEFGGVNGTLAGRLRGDNGDALVIAEPSGLDINNGNRGGVLVHILLRGAEGILFEEGEPGQAVRQLAHLLPWVDEFRRRRRSHLASWRPGSEDPVPVWVTKISGGGWGWNVPVTVPAEVRLELYWQLLPGEEEEAVLGEFERWLRDMAAADPLNFKAPPPVERPIRFMPAAEIPTSESIVQVLQGAAQRVTGKIPAVQPMMAPSDLFVAQRDFKIPTVHYGGRGGGAHAADEYLVVDDLVTVTQTLALLALEWCEVAE
jgi:acetylornithine deacetylase